MKRILLHIFACAVLVASVCAAFAGTLYDLVRMTTPTTGANYVVSLGVAVPGFRSFSQAGVPDGATVSIGIFDAGGSPVQSLTGRGTYSAGANSVTITQIIASTNNDAMIPLSGSAQIFISPNALDIETVTAGSTGTNGVAPGDLLVASPSNACNGSPCLADSGINKSLNGLFNAPNVQSANYTIAASDCNGTVVETGAFQTITLPSSLTGFPSSCPVRIVNGSSTRAQALSNFPSSLPTRCGGACLWPNQSVTVGIASGAWIVIAAPGRWKPPSLGGVQLFASPSGSDNNDCLSSASPCATIGNALNIVQDNIDFSGGSNVATINLASGTYNECIFWVGPIVGVENVYILGSLSSPSSYIINCANNYAVQARDHSIVTLEGLTLTAQTAAYSAISASQFSAIDLDTVILNGDSGGIDIQAFQLGTVNIVGPVTAGSSVAIFALVYESANLTINSNITIDFGVTVGTFAEPTELGSIVVTGAPTITNNGTVTNMCSISLLGLLNRGGITFPGAVCTPATGGQLN